MTVLLFIEIFNQYLYYFQFGGKTEFYEGVPIEIKHLRGLRNLINDHLEVCMYVCIYCVCMCV